MKKFLIAAVTLLTMVAFAGASFAQAPAKTETPAAAAPAAEKAKIEKPKMARTVKASGTVAAYEEGKMITVKGTKKKEWTFEITPDTKVKGEIKEGAKVTVIYKKEGDKMVASAISIGQAKKKTASKK